MKILVVSQFFYPEQFRINDICREWIDLQYDVTVLTGLPNYPTGIIPPEYKGRKRRTEVIDGVKVIRSWLIPRGKGKLGLSLNYVSFAFSAAIKACFMKKEYDIVFCFQTSPVTMCLPAIIMKKRSKAPFVLYCLDQWPASLAAMNITEESLLYKILSCVSRWIYKKADRLLISSRMFENYFKKVHNIEGNVTYLPIYSEALFENLDCKKEHEGFHFVFAGNIGKMQSVDTIIKAAKLLENHNNITFHIVGDGSALTDVQELANELELGNTVFYGCLPIEKMPEFYAMADAMLVTLSKDSYITNTLPGKVQTYMAAGKPIIAAIDGETCLVMEEAGCGLCGEAMNENALAENILKFINEPQHVQIYAGNSLRYYREVFDKSRFFNVLTNIFNEVKKRGKN
ncbi:MAG: glycosyltransferase WbuB [Clostridiales bacterium 43-6]|nr:MAG: glycosyltransferase WbuB [Clostridiales bacterium 43-6]